MLFDKNKSGFTLAEVLITLGIIGIVAALTIPTIIGNSQKTQAEAGLKKAYSEIYQAIALAKIDYGDTDNWNWPGNGLSLTQYFADNYFYPYLKIMKSCAYAEAGCWQPPVSLSNLSGYLPVNANLSSESIILPDGASILFWGGQSPEHIQFWVDIDGPYKGSAKIGKDVFSITFFPQGDATFKKGIFLGGSDVIAITNRTQLMTDANLGCSKSINTMFAGTYCAGLIGYDGFRIADDYPWN